MKVLSILIPTYNRAAYLKQLLFVLNEQLGNRYEHEVEVIVADNASTDETDVVLEKVSSNALPIRIIRRKANIGTDGNIADLVSQSLALFCWVIGDDDLPFPGLLPHLVDYLRHSRDDLVYLPAQWTRNTFHDYLNNHSIIHLSSEAISKYEFASRTHIRLSFISSIVFSSACLRRSDELKKAIVYSNLDSRLNQLTWIFYYLSRNNCQCAYMPNKLVYATSGNTRSYSILHVFLLSYPTLVLRYLSIDRRLVRSLINPFLSSYLPRLILATKSAYKTTDDSIFIYCLIKSIRLLGKYPRYWLFVFPLLMVPQQLVALCYPFSTRLYKMILLLAKNP